MAGRDVSLHPPVLEFVRVNRPASDILSVAPSPPWVPPLGFVRPVPPARQFHPRGFSPPRRLWHTERSGFVAPQYRTGFAEFPTRGTRIRRCWPSRAFPISAFTPFEDFPSLVAVLHHCSRCPLGVRQMNAPYDGLTTSAALTHSGSTCASDPKTHPQAVCMLLPPSLETGHPLTVDRLDYRRFWRRLPDRTLFISRFDPPTRFFVDKSRTPSHRHTTSHVPLRCLSFFLRPGGPGSEVPDITSEGCCPCSAA